MAGKSKPRGPDFSGAFLKLDRAKGHIADFEATAEKAMRGNLHIVFPERDPVLQRYGFVIGNRRRLPLEELSLIAGDAVHNLRSALDHLITACVLANRGNPQRCYFPIERTAKQLEKSIKKYVVDQGAGARAEKIVRDAKPHRRSNAALFGIHCLDIADKHQLLIATKPTLDVAINLDGVTVAGSFKTARKTRRFIPLPEGMDENLLPAEVSLTSDLVFGSRRPRAGKPCIEELAAFVMETERVIKLFAAAF